MAKRKLISEPDHFPDLYIFGITSQLKDYRLAYYVNRDCDIMLAKLEDLPLFIEKDEITINYSLYAYINPTQHLNYFLLINNNEGNRILPNSKQADFLLLVNGQTGTLNAADLIADLRKIPGVQFAFNIEKEKIKNLDGIMSDLEIHLVENSQRSG